MANPVQNQNLVNLVQKQNATSLSLAPVRETMETNFFGLIQTTVAFLPLLRKPTHAVVLNVSTALGSNTLQARPSASLHAVGYNTSKAAANSYTIALAQELKGEGIKVNAVTPGFTATKINHYHGAAKPVRAGAESLLPWALLEKDGPTCMLNLLDLRAAYI